MKEVLDRPVSSFGPVEEGTHIFFVPVEPRIRTEVWSVLNRYDHKCLGHIEWFGRWRKYAFFPNSETVFEEICLREIAEFCESVSGARRSKLASVRALS